MNNQEFPDLIKAGLKVGDNINSYLYGKGVVTSITNTPLFPISVSFRLGEIAFKSNGLEDSEFLCPAIHITPWNPISGEPFPFPKWEPIVGEAYAFWLPENIEGGLGFHVNNLHAITVGHNHPYMAQSGYRYKQCAPIEEAMRIFGFDKPQQL
jgi:hypothetical protein